MKKIVFTFGRYNPPTTGHAELITYTVKLAQKTGADHRIYTSQSQDPSKNPLSARQKMTFLRQIFPGVNFVDDPAARSAFIIAKKLADEGYEDVTFVVGADRVNEFKTSMSKYVKPKTAKDFNPKIHYPFKKFQVVSSGARKKGISGTDLRNAVRKGDFATFARASAAKDKTLAKKIYATTKAQLNEHMSRKEFDGHLKSFIDFTCDKLGILEKPLLKYKEPTDQGEQPSFAAYSPGSKEVYVMTKNRHPMDVFRSVAHELVHHKQNEEGRIGKDTKKEGATGSDIENEANARAGELMRWYGKANPQCFSMSYVTEEEQIDEINKGIIRRYKGAANVDLNRLSVDSSNRNYGNPNKKSPEYYDRKIKNRVTGINRAQERFYGEKPYSFREEKAIILAGTPGSGKDKILKESILPHGFTEISSDRFDIKTIQGNVVVNGSTGYERVRYIKEQLEGADYQTMMVFVNTSNEVSKQRNEARTNRGGRVINEAVRYTKWKTAQDNLAKYDQLFEKVIEVKNDLDLNQDQEIIQETYNKLMKSVSKEIAEFILSDADRRFEMMLEGNFSDFGPTPRNNPTGGAGNWGTSKLTDRYKADTPGETPGVTRQMGYYDTAKKTKVKVFGNLPKFGDRIGATYTSAKNPSFAGDTTGDQNVFMPMEPMQKWTAIDRWSMNEETRKRFKEKYGKLAEQKIKETAEKLKKESLIDPFMGSMGSTPNTMAQDEVKPDINAEFEKTALFGKRKFKKAK